MAALFLGVVAGFGIAIPVGAIAVLIVQVGIRCGFRCGASAGAGAATADLVYAVAAVLGGVALAASFDAAGDAVRWVSAGALTVIAVRGLKRGLQERTSTATVAANRKEYVQTYGKFLGLTIINPLTVVYFAAVVLGFGLADGLRGVEAVLFVTGVFLASLTWQTILAGTGAAIGRNVSRRLQLVAVTGGNLLVLAMAVVIAAG